MGPARREALVSPPDDLAQLRHDLVAVHSDFPATFDVGDASTDFLPPSGLYLRIR